MNANLKHIEALQSAAIDLEAQLRANGRYSKDCGRVNDAIARGQKSGVALLWDAAGRLEVVDLNGGSKRCDVTEIGANGVTIAHDFPTWENPTRTERHRDETRKIVEEGAESYEVMAGENWERAKTKSHEREKATEGRFEPQSHATDAARLARELKAKQIAAADKEKNIRMAAYRRNEEIATRMKEATNKIWGNGRIA